MEDLERSNWKYYIVRIVVIFTRHNVIAAKQNINAYAAGNVASTWKGRNPKYQNNIWAETAT